MTAEEWDRRKGTIRTEIGSATLGRDFRHLRDASHEERILELAVIEAECGKPPLATAYLAEAKLGVAGEDLQEILRIGASDS